MTIRVLVADDQEIVRAGYTRCSTPSGADAVRLCRERRPDVVLMDVRMPTMDGIEATRQLAADHSSAGPRVLVLTTFDLDQHVYDALSAGASGFSSRTSPPSGCSTPFG